MTKNAVLTGAYLDHLAYESSDPKRLAEFHSAAMDMNSLRISDKEWRCSGPERRIIVLAGTDRKLAYAGFTCLDADNLQEFHKYACDNGVEIQENPSPWLCGNAFAVVDPDGNKVCFGLNSGEKILQTGLRGRLQHLTFATFDPDALVSFYHEKLGFRVTDRVFDEDGNLTGCFMTSTHEHHTIACFKSNRQGIDHHCHEVIEWDTIRDWCDHFAGQHIKLVWGPGRHGPGNNLFAFIEDPDGNMIEVSAELEMVHDRQVKDWIQEPRTLNLWGWAINRTP
ncbi:hypothetical protein A9Q83_00030 [Alphaproteobacteria bacterium 46_93_T64]|nr:hypothetical protein A9Q83_00030 [Alphaproteobacteria bacterium 46_93_T64]